MDGSNFYDQNQPALSQKQLIHRFQRCNHQKVWNKLIITAFLGGYKAMMELRSMRYPSPTKLSRLDSLAMAGELRAIR